jgi:hypothetical protein
MNKRDLWLRLRAYHFDHIVAPHLWNRITEAFGGSDASTKAFADKIARKLHWNGRFAARAINEYKKFIYLGSVSNFTVTPSKTIDQVWHEHLLFTKAYRDFCSDVLGFSFDHNPELIPITSETGIFNAQYLDTLELYKTEFGIDPPDDIWSIPKFKKSLVLANTYESKKKIAEGKNNPYYSEMPLCSYFDSTETSSIANFDGFDGGNGGGAGSSGSWGDESDGASDSGSDGGSSCSSSCGGGD